MISSYEVTIERRYTMYCRRSRSSEYDTDHYSEHYSEIPNHAPTCPNYNAEYDPDSTSVIPSHTATMLLPHIMTPYEISLWRSNDL